MKKGDIVLLVLVIALVIAAIITLLIGGERSRHGVGALQPGNRSPDITYRKAV